MKFYQNKRVKNTCASRNSRLSAPQVHIPVHYELGLAFLLDLLNPLHCINYKKITRQQIYSRSNSMTVTITFNASAYLGLE